MRYKTFRRSAKRFYKKKGIRSRRYRKTYRKTYRRKRLSDSTVYRFSRTLEYNVDGPQNGGTVAEVVGAKLSNVPGYTEFVNLFEEYKITKVKFTFMPRQGFQYAGNLDHGTFHIWNDYDDNVNPTNDEWKQKQDVKSYNLSCNSIPKFTHTLLPRYQVPVYRTGVNFGYSSQKGKWINMVNDDVQYYGTKYVWTNTQLAGPTIIPRLHVYMKIYMKFRRPK